MNKKENKYSKYISSIDEIITSAKNGKMFILVDEDDRENEGDIIIPAEKITPEEIEAL